MNCRFRYFITFIMLIIICLSQSKAISRNSGGDFELKSKSITAVIQPILRMQISNGTNIDEAIVYFNPNASNSYDAYDSPKMFNASTSLPEIYTVAGSEQLAINGLNSISYNTEYPVGLLIMYASVANYSIKASQFSNFPTGAKILLKDKLNSSSPVTTDLTNGDSYAFTSGALNYNTSRFALIIKSPDPTITTTGTLSAVNSTYGTASPVPTTFKVSGSFLTANIVLSAPTGYEISKTSGGASGYNSTLTLIQSGGTVTETTIYLRLTSTAVSDTYSGNISCVSSGATTVNLATVSSTVSKKSLTISGLTALSKSYDGTNSASFTGSAIFSGFVNNENYEVTGTPTATFADASVGTGKTVTITGYNNPSANYTVVSPTFTTDITALSTTITNSGNIGSSGLLPGTDITVISDVELAINNSSTVHSIVLNPGAKLNLNSGKTLSVGTLTLQSNETATATFIDGGGTLNSGNTYVQQYLTTGRNWYISSPVSNAGSSVFSPIVLNPLYFYDEVHGSDAPWIQISDSNTPLTVMKGYVASVVSDGVVTFSGTLNTATQSINVTRTTGQNKEGFNLVGNPYPSYLDWDQVDKNNLLTTMWYRTINNANAYIFDTYNSTAHLGTSNGIKRITNLIPPMQAFWVRVNEGQTQAVLSVDNSKRVHSDYGNNTLKAKELTNLNQQVLHLQVSNGTNTDETIIYSNPAASNVYDDYDSPKMFNNSAIAAVIYTVSANEQLAINGLSNIPYDTEILLGFSTTVSGNFSIKASEITNFAPGTQIILKDYRNTDKPVLTDLSDGKCYSFTSDATSDMSRFRVIIHAPSAITAIDASAEKPNVYISTNANGRLMINGVITAETSLMVYNFMGQCVINKVLTSPSAVIDAVLCPGVYTVIVCAGGKSTIQKMIVK